MFLTRVELFGFKSFADRTRIDFQEGITVLLGPNGCGKSNIVDAIKWVLGEQSTKSMRADRMEEVIFNGTENRRAMDVAEVSLVVENEERLLHLDLPELVIKRRLYRNGESLYLVNDAPVKLKELRALFLDTGIGKSAYSVMEQGKIDQILSHKPEERRFLFEEAAGISKSLVQRNEAGRKLEKTQENMERVKQILHEVERRHETLKKQMERTISYRDLKQTLFENDRDSSLLQGRSLARKRIKEQARLEEHLRKQALLSDKIKDATTRLDAITQEINQTRSQHIERQKKLYGVDLERESRETQARLLDEQAKEMEEGLGTLTAKEKATQGRVAHVEATRVEKERHHSLFSERLREVEKSIVNCQESLSCLTEEEKKNAQKIVFHNQSFEGKEEARAVTGEDLRTLVDAIVEELEKNLFGEGMIEAKERLERLITTMRAVLVHIDGRVALFSDWLEVETKNVDEFSSLVSNAKATLEEVANHVAALLSLVEEAKERSFAPLDELLSPSGIVAKKKSIDQKLRHLSQSMRADQEKANELEARNKVLQGEAKKVRSDLEELRVNRAQIEAKREAVVDSLDVSRREKEEALSQLEEIKSAASRQSKRIISLRDSLQDLEKGKERLHGDEETLKGELINLQESMAVRQREKQAREEEQERRREASKREEIASERAKMEVARLDTEITTLDELFRDRTAKRLSDYEQHEVCFTQEVLREQKRKVKESLRSLGQVNLMAPEEFAETEERRQFLLHQVSDLEKAKKDLKTVTEEINRESAKRFLESLKEIQGHFHALFRRLFGGGRTELRLTNPDDLLTSGIEIYVQPPGKKLKSIALLSGGERSLTGVCLLFAVSLVKPSPLYVLDEIDAALDEANIGRFGDLLREFSAKTQILVISHNKRTIASAKTLLGVTMQESGVSTLMAVRLDEGEERR